MNASKRLLALLLSLPLLAAAQDRPPPDLRGEMPAKVVEIDLDAAAKVEPMRLEPEDELRMIVVGHPELTHIARVQTDGRATLPLVGDLPVQGLTLQQVQESIQARIERRAGREPLTFRPGDQIEVTVWRHPDLTHTGLVQSDGMLALPLIGQVKAEGRSLDALHDEVARRMAQFLREPQVSLLPVKLTRPADLLSADVSILLEHPRLRMVTVLGEVGIQGPQLARPGLRIIDALAAAHYSQNGADLDSVMLIRNSHGQVPEYKQLRLAAFLDGKAADQNIPLRPDDVVIVPKTTITKIGDFIERFFTRTRPALDWWNSLQQARFASDINRYQIDYYRSLTPP